MDNACATTEEFSRANCANSYVIEPDGDICKCWHEVGEKEAVIGNVLNLNRPRPKNQRLHKIRRLTWEAVDYPPCIECRILPICIAGCGYNAMFAVGKPLCLGWKYDMEKYVLVRYKLERSKPATSKHRHPS